MSDKPNGTTPTLKRWMIPISGRTKVVYTMSDGSYVGTMEYDAISMPAVLAMLNDLQALAAQQAGGIIASAGMPMPGLKPQ